VLETAGRTVLEGGKQGKDMFDKGELAAILRFGAQNLFQGEQRDQQLYEEDIDAILARAEVVDQRVQVSPAFCPSTEAFSGNLRK
jgi:chromodomain-helicase-DNA-binding protein 1